MQQASTSQLYPCCLVIVVLHNYSVVRVSDRALEFIDLDSKGRRSDERQRCRQVAHSPDLRAPGRASIPGVDVGLVLGWGRLHQDYTSFQVFQKKNR